MQPLPFILFLSLAPPPIFSFPLSYSRLELEKSMNASTFLQHTQNKIAYAERMAASNLLHHQLTLNCNLPNHLVDCSGNCIDTENHCSVASLHYTSCSQYISDGFCNGPTPTYISDLGVFPNFNCPRFSCDGGDCEVCGHDTAPRRLRREGVDPALMQLDGDSCRDSLNTRCAEFSCDEYFCDDCEFAGLCDKTCGLCDKMCAPPTSPPPPHLPLQSKFCIILTSAISPSQTVTNSRRNAPNLRRREYKRTVSSYLNALRKSRSPLPVIFVENSGANLTQLRAHVQEGDNFEFLSFIDAESRSQTARGKGVAEYRSIQFAIDNSMLIRTSGCEMVVKITGRYFVPEIIESNYFVDNFSDEGLELIVQSTENFWNMWEDDGGILRSEVVGFKKNIAAWLFEGQDEEIGLPVERILLLKSRELMKLGKMKVGKFGELAIEPTKNAENVWIEGL